LGKRRHPILDSSSTDGVDNETKVGGKVRVPVAGEKGDGREKGSFVENERYGIEYWKIAKKGWKKG